MTAADEPQRGEPCGDEQQLIFDAKTGSHAAFRCLVERHMKQTYTIAFSFVRSHDRAQEITQEVFVKAHASLSSFRGDSEFGTWLYRITTNLSLNHVKQLQRSERRSVSIVDAMEVSSGHDGHVTDGNDQREHIERALHDLPTLQRAVVILRHIDGLSTKQVSRILRCSEGTVKTHLFRGLKKMRKRLVFLQEEMA